MLWLDSQEEKTKDENLLLAYQALRCFILLLKKPNNPERDKAKETDKDNEKGSEADNIEDAMDDIAECIKAIQQPTARLMLLECLYVSLFTTSRHIRGEAQTAGALLLSTVMSLISVLLFFQLVTMLMKLLANPCQHTVHQAPSFIVTEKVVAPILNMLASSLVSIPDSPRKLELKALVEDAQWRLNMVLSSRALGGSALVPAVSVMACISASPDGLAANCLSANGNHLETSSNGACSHVFS